MEFEITKSPSLTIKLPSGASINVDPYDLYWAIVRWEEEELPPTQVLEKLADLTGQEMPAAYAAQLYPEIIRIGEMQQEAARKKLETAREQIANSPDSIQAFRTTSGNGEAS